MQCYGCGYLSICSQSVSANVCWLQTLCGIAVLTWRRTCRHTLAPRSVLLQTSSPNPRVNMLCLNLAASCCVNTRTPVAERLHWGIPEATWHAGRCQCAADHSPAEAHLLRPAIPQVEAVMRTACCLRVLQSNADENTHRSFTCCVTGVPNCSDKLDPAGPP